MEDVDDDFGDLYADIDDKTINDIPDFKQLYLENSDLQTTASIEEANPSLIANDVENCIDLDSENESDSEDDLNIVLNDDDCPKLVTASVRNGGGVVGDDVEDGGGLEKDLISNNRKLGHDGFEHGGSNALGSESYFSQFAQYKYVRPSAGAFTNNAKVDKSVRAALCLSQFSLRGDLNDTTCNPTLAQSGYSFSLPWHKSITDINIDTFELKPWRCPGVNITDFFNYGFNEESWKQYCTSLDQNRRQASMLTRIPVYETSRHSRTRRTKFDHEVEAYEATSGNRAEARVENGGSPPFKVKVSDGEARHLELPRGRAILIEGSTYERRPSLDIRRPRNRDSDVVIQITVQDSMDDSGSGKKESGHIESTICETSETERFNINDGRDFQSCGGNSEDELPLESPEGSDKRSDILDAHKRSLQEEKMLNSISKDSCSQEDVHLPDVGRNHYRNVAVYDLKRTSEAAELPSSQREEIDRKTCERDSCSRETESSHSSQIQQSPCLSCSTHSKAVDSEITWTTSRRLPLDVSACELDLFEDPQRNTFKMKSRTYNNSKRKRSAVYEEVKAHPRRHATDALPKIKSRSHKDSERQRGSVLEEQEVFHKRPVDGTLAENSSPDHRNTSNVRKKEIHCHRNHAKGGHGRQTKRLHHSDPYEKDDILYFGASDLPPRCYKEKCVHHGAQDACPKIPWREEDQRCRDDVDLYFRRQLDDEEYYLERGSIRCRDESIEGDWYYHERGIPAEKEGPLTYTRDGHWRRESIASNTMRRYDSDEFACESEHCDHFMQQERRGPSAYRKRRWDSWDEKYERRFSCFGKEAKTSSWRERHRNKSSDWGGLHFLGNSDGYRREMGQRSISSEYTGESFTDHERRQNTMSPQSQIYHSRTERHGRHGRKICVERFRDSGLCGSSDDAYKGENGITYPEDIVQFGQRTNLGFKSYKFKPNEELLFRHRDEVYFNNASYSYKRTMRQENIHVNRGSTHLHFDDKQLKLDKHKRGGSDNICVGTYADTVHSDKHQHSNVRCGEPVDLHLVVGKGKSRRHSKAGTSLCNGTQDDLRHVIDREWSTRELDYFHSEKVIQNGDPKVESLQNNEIWVNKCPVTLHDMASELEEGQMVMDKLNEGHFMEVNIHASEGAVQTGCTDKKVEHDISSDGNKFVGEFGNNRILEMIEKMEKRRERFKDPIYQRKEPDCNFDSEPQINSLAETDETKPQRPARKRRWGGK